MDATFGEELLSDVSAFFQSAFHVDGFQQSAHCGSLTPYSGGHGRRLLSRHAFHAMQNAYTATVLLYVVGTANATRWASALASSVSAFGFTGALSMAVVPAGQTVLVAIPCSASTSVPVGGNCSEALSTTAASSADNGDGGLSAGAIAGVVIGAVLGSALLCCLLLLLMREAAKRDSATPVHAHPASGSALPPSPSTSIVDDRYILHHTPTPPLTTAAVSVSSAHELYEEVMTPHRVREEERSSRPRQSQRSRHSGHHHVSVSTKTQRLRLQPQVDAELVEAQQERQQPVTDGDDEEPSSKEVAFHRDDLSAECEADLREVEGVHIA